MDQTKQLKDLAKEVTELREDVNLIAYHLRDFRVEVTEQIEEIEKENEDLDGKILDLLESMQEESQNDEYALYIKELVSEDFREREDALLKSVKKLLLVEREKNRRSVKQIIWILLFVNILIVAGVVALIYAKGGA